MKLCKARENAGFFFAKAQPNDAAPTRWYAEAASGDPFVPLTRGAFTMCVKLQFVFKGQQRTLIIGPAEIIGPVPVPNQRIDARLFFTSDERYSNLTAINQGKNLEALKNAAQVVATSFEGSPVVWLFCSEGRSRSPRVAGAFLRRSLNMTAQEALQVLRDGYANHRTDNCVQQMNEDNVSEWLIALG